MSGLNPAEDEPAIDSGNQANFNETTLSRMDSKLTDGPADLADQNWP
jgi:hypothetical protein